MTRFIKIAAVTLLVVFLAAIAAKHLIEYKGRAVAGIVIDDARVTANDPEALAVALTLTVYNSYKNTKPQEGLPLLLRLRPFLTNKLLPEFLRVRAGALEAIYVMGQCDSAARTLQFLLIEANFPAEQFNIVRKHNGGHSVTLVELPSGREAMLDALFGVVPEQDGQMLSPEQARELVRRGVPVDRIWRKLTPTSDAMFYTRFDEAVFAKQDAGLDIEILVEIEAGEPILLGAPDGSWNDVADDGAAHGYTAYWHYMGHRYDRGWRRVVRFAQNTRMIIGLVETPNERFITTKQRPLIQGNELIYEMGAGETLNFEDGASRRDWLQFRSHQDVDYIRFEPI